VLNTALIASGSTEKSVIFNAFIQKD